MYIKLTKLNGSPIWLNASFIVTVEPGMNGGAIVVPIGDGLDYDVRESPDAVLEMLEGAPAATVVPVPSSMSIPKANKATAKKGAEATKTDKPTDAAADDAKAVAKPEAKKTTRTRAKAKTEKEVPKAEIEVPLTADQVERLRKLSPKSVRKLQNTLTSQFSIAEVNAAISSLVNSGVLSVDGSHVIWSQIQPMPAPEAEVASDEQAVAPADSVSAS